MAWRTNRGAAALGPFEPKLPLCIIGSGGDLHSPSRIRKRAVFDRIRAEFIENHRQRQHGPRTDFHIRALHQKSTATLIKWRNGGFHNVRERRARPICLQQQIVNAPQREQPALDCLSAVLQAVGGPQALLGNRHHRGQSVLHPVVQFLQQKPLQPLSNLVFGSV